MNTKLTIVEVGELKKHEKIIEAGKKSFLEVASALWTIRDKKLYRQDFPTFEDYCQKRWDFSRQYASAIIKSAEVVKALPDKLSTTVDTEGAARTLGKVPEAQRIAVVKEASNDGDTKVTSVSIKKAQEKIEAKKATVELDGIGNPVTEKAMLFWRRIQWIQDNLIKPLKNVRHEFKEAKEGKDLLFVEVNLGARWQRIELSFKNVIDDIEQLIKPFAVCPTCQGKIVETCAFCGGRGVISKFLYQTVTEEQKKLIEKKGQKK